MRQSQTKPGTAMVRALFRSIPVEGAAAHHPQLAAKIYYPAVFTGSDLEKNTGALPIEPGDTPYPLAILMPGINVTPESYSWLAIELVKAGFICVSYGWILEEMPGLIALSPGLDISALTPDEYRNRPSANALASVIAALNTENKSGPLAGRLNLDQILLGGHSAGGSVAIFNADDNWFTGLKAVFAYGSHSKASTMLGYEADTVLKLPSRLPTLILGGSEDGVIAASAFRYGDDGNQAPDPIGPLQRTFDEGLDCDRQDSHLAIVAGANHFSMCWPQDSTTGRPFLDWPETRDNTAIRKDLTQLICQFGRATVLDDDTANQALLSLLEDRDRISLHKVR